MKISGAGKALADQLRSDYCAAAPDKFAVRLIGHQPLCQHRNCKRIANAEQQSGDNCVKNGRDELLAHFVLPFLNQMNRCDRHVDQLDAEEWQHNAANAIEHQIAP